MILLNAGHNIGARKSPACTLLTVPVFRASAPVVEVVHERLRARPVLASVKEQEDDVRYYEDDQEQRRGGH